MGGMLASTLFCAEDMVSCLSDPTARELRLCSLRSVVLHSEYPIAGKKILCQRGI